MYDRAKLRSETGFTLVEVVLATALFVFVAFAGFEALRALVSQVTVLASRASATSQLVTTAAAMRSDALSSVAIWKPASTCGDAVAFMLSEAGRAQSFLVYVARPVAGTRALALYRARSATGAIDPCDPALVTGTLIDSIAGLHVSSVRAGDLATHADVVSNAIDGAIFRSSGISSIAVDAHARDFDGTPILTGNGVTEVTIDAEPVQRTLDLVAGNRPSGFTNVLGYTCGARCQGTAMFPETRGAGLTNCSIGYDLPDTPAFYAPAAGQPTYVPAGGGRLRPVISAYAIDVGAIFTFTGAGGARAQEELYVHSDAWSSPGMQDVPVIASDGSVSADYRTNSVRSAGAGKIFSDLAGATTLAPQFALCAGINAETNDFQS